MEPSVQNLPPVLAIAGPTASGKSALAVAVAKRVGGEVVNADALQVYDGLRVLTARPTADEMAGVPHHLFGHIDPARRYSVGAWAQDVGGVLSDITKRGSRAVLVGGTGLYFTSLFKGLADVPEVGDAVRTEVKAMEIGALAEEAERVDPMAFARIQGDDPQRLIRIVSVARDTGRALSVWQADTAPIVTDWAGVVIMPDREALYARIEARFDAMLDMGARQEIAQFAARGLPEDLPAMKAIGVSQLLRAYRGEIEEGEAIALAKRDTRRLAKRQMTWFRNQTPKWPRLGLAASVDDALAAFGQDRS